MIERHEFDLLKDIVRLLIRYGPETFEELAKYLQEPGSADHLVTILKASAAVGRKRISSPKEAVHGTPGRAGLRDLLRQLEETEPQKFKLLSEFHSDLLAKNALPSLREVKAFAQDCGLDPVRATSRDRALLPLLKDLSRRPMEEVKAIIGQVHVRAQREDRTLEGWAGIILKNRRPEDKR